MKTVAASLMCACFVLAAGGVAAQDAKPKAMTLQQCKDHMAMRAKDGMKPDPKMKKTDVLCADMIDRDKRNTEKMKK